VNILLISTHCNAGGITSYLYTITKGMIRRGHTVHIATSGGNMDEAFKSAGAEVKNYNIRTKSELDPRIYMALRPLARYIRDHDINVIHAHTRITQVMGVFLKKMTGCPYVATCHGFFKTKVSRRLAPCWGDEVIAISSAVSDHLINDFHMPSQKVQLIESGVDLEAIRPADESVKIEQRNRFNLGDAPVIGNVARLSDVKGPDILIDAMKSIVACIPECQLILVGEGKMEGDLRNRVKRLELQEHVRFLSVINRTSEMLTLFDVFVMPSRQEGLGLSIMEAQAAGLPVVASRVGGIPSLIEDGRTGILVEPEDSAALALAIINLFQDKNRLKAIGVAGRESIKNNYNVELMLDKTENFYKRMVAH
jgi:glycosyltransferase involved in cell wall biosynthesis